MPYREEREMRRLGEPSHFIFMGFLPHQKKLFVSEQLFSLFFCFMPSPGISSQGSNGQHQETEAGYGT